MSFTEPKTNCNGCDARDALIAKLALALDEAQSQAKMQTDQMGDYWLKIARQQNMRANTAREVARLGKQLRAFNKNLGDSDALEAA